MSEKQNVTLSIPRNVLIEAKIVAIRQGQSLSGLMTDLLSELVERHSTYELAKAQALQHLRDATPLDAAYTWTRDELHERQ